MSTHRNNSVSGLAWKIPVIAVVNLVGTMIAGAAITAAGMPWPTVPNQPSQTTNFLLSAFGSLLMAVCLALLARGIRGSRPVRWLVLATFSYVIFGLNNQIEAAAFTSFGGTGTMILFFVAPCLLSAAAAAWLVDPGPELQDGTVGPRPLLSWWRVVIAWLAFPVIYIFFGMLVSPIVVPFYQDPSFGLKLPGWGTMLLVVLLRSALALAVTLPVLALWSRSRRSLLVALAITFFALMGAIGLAATTFLPPTLRIAHSLEILADSLVYSWVLVALLVSKNRPEPAVASATTELRA